MRSEIRNGVFGICPEGKEGESPGRSERYTFPGATLLGRFWCSFSFEMLVKKERLQ